MPDIIYVAHAPTGSRIIGTWDTIPGTAYGLIYKETEHDVCIQSDFDGETDVDWNGQEQVEDDGERLYVCAEGNIWRESLLEWKAEVQ